MNKVKQKLCDKDGATVIEIGVGFLIGCLIIALILQVVPIFLMKNQLNTYATNVSRILSVEGIYNDEVKSIIEDYRVTSEIGNVTLSLEDTEFISDTNKIQLNDPIVVTVLKEYELGFFTFGSFKIPLKNKAIARSEVYWKE